MSSTDAFKLLEAGVLLAAGVAFGWWQLRDVAKAREASRRAGEQEAERAEKAARPAPSVSTTSSPTPEHPAGNEPGTPHHR